MRIVKLIMTRFRGISGTTTIYLSDRNVIVGRNDSGKSTILKAIDLFLNDTEPSSEMLNVYSTDSTCEIELIFSHSNRELVIDESIPTTLEDEELVDESGYLRIKKVWDTSKSKIKPDLHLYRKIYSQDDFLMNSEQELITACESNEIETRKANNEMFNNVEKRAKLREKYGREQKPYQYGYQQLPSTGKGRGKLIYDAIKEILPRFEYFHADTSLSESDTVIQKYFKQLAMNILKNRGIEDIEEAVKEGVGKVLGDITNKINEVLPEEQKVEPSVSFNWSNIVQTSFKTQDEEKSLPLSFRGDGFRRITMMSYFEYLAEESLSENQDIIFAFEEPETFLHPSAQEQLYDRLENLSDSGYQVLITTHSPIIVSRCSRAHLIHITIENKNYHVNVNMTDFSQIIKDLGVSPGNQFIREFEKGKLLVLVEGPDDVKAFHFIAKNYKDNGVIQEDFSDLDIVLIPIGGCESVRHWFALNILKDLDKPFYIIQDSDRNGPTESSPRQQQLDDLGLRSHEDYWLLRKRTLENYIQRSALERAIPGIVIEYDEFTKMKDVCRKHRDSKLLGKDKVVETHFNKQTHEELRRSFQIDGTEDEFVEIINRIKNKLSAAS